MRVFQGSVRADVGNIMYVYDHIGGEFDKYRSEIGLCDVLALIDEMGRDIHVLDLGCGTGHPIAVRIAPMVSRYLGVDNSAPMLDAFKQNAPAAECRLLDMALVARVGGCWDLIFSYGAICHLSRDGQVAALTAISGLLKSGGRLLFTGAEQEGHCTGSVGPYVDVIDHYSLGRAGYTALLEKSGMRQLWAEARDGGNFTYLYEKGANHALDRQRAVRTQACARPADGQRPPVRGEQMTVEIRQMVIADYDAAYALWSETEGMSLGDDDTRDRIALYLTRNPGLCFVATVTGGIVGTVLCGHEGRRGILRHLAVKRAFRRQGIARGLASQCLTALAGQGIRKCNIFVLDENPDGLRFWEHMGWYRLENNYRTLQHLTDARG